MSENRQRLIELGHSLWVVVLVLKINRVTGFDQDRTPGLCFIIVSLHFHKGLKLIQYKIIHIT